MALQAAVTVSGEKITADRHEQRFVNDGNYGNSRSWMASEIGKGWVELEFEREQTIERVVWGRDREGKFTDRLAIDYQIEIGDMPPEDDVDELPTADERKAMVREIETVLAKLEKGDFPRNPGRTTLRRLNRVEYANAVRELLDFPVDVSSQLPTDDSGYGFDNIGSVLSMSPLLMEKYLAAADQVVARLRAAGGAPWRTLLAC